MNTSLAGGMKNGLGNNHEMSNLTRRESCREYHLQPAADIVVNMRRMKPSSSEGEKGEMGLHQQRRHHP